MGSGASPGAAALVARGDDVEVESAGELTPDSIVRIASMGKPITAAALLVLVDEGVVALADPIARWLPELATPSVVRSPESPLGDLVPVARAITVEDVLTSRAGWGFLSDLSLPAVEELFRRLPLFDVRETPDEWLRSLAAVPLLRQPGEAWLYNTCSDIQGVLISRASDKPLPEFFAERVFEPLRMVDTDFYVPARKLDRLPPYHAHDAMLAAADWTRPPPFPSGAGGLVSTLADWHRFGRMLLDGGDGLLSRESVQRMTTNHLTPEQRNAATVLLEGAGWGFGGCVEPDGSYGWNGGIGTTARIKPSTGTVAILLTQQQMPGPVPLMREFWRYAFKD